MPPRSRTHLSAGLGLQITIAAALVVLLFLPLLALFRATSWGELVQAAGDPAVRASLGLTLLASAISLGLVLLFGIPTGYLFARRPFRGKLLVESFITLPTVLPHVIGGLAILLLVAPDSPLGSALARYGFPPVETIWGVVMVMFYVSVAYTVLASEVAFRAIDRGVVEAARSLGASPSEAFASVVLPGALRGILAGALLSWGRGISEIGGFLLVAYAVYPTGPYAGPVTSPLSVFIFNLYQIGDLSGAVAVSALLVLLAFAIFAGARWAALHGSETWRWVRSVG